MAQQDKKVTNRIGGHAFRATGMTISILKDGILEKA
jgi:hypothetical protein